MYIGYSEEQEQLRRELRAYYDKLLTPVPLMVTGSPDGGTP